MNIAGLQKTTLVDFPGKIAATVFTRGCSFRCPFCHNPELVLTDQFISLMDENKVMDFFEMRKDQLQGVCITGGEPTLQKDLPEFIQKLKNLGYAIKLDTNGSTPHICESLIKTGNIDYIAMDIKASPEKYALASGSEASSLSFRPRELCRTGGEILSKDPSTPVGMTVQNDQLKNDKLNENWKLENEKLIANIKRSIRLVMQSGIDYEFRTTVCHPIHEVADFEEIGQLIKGAKCYFIQNFVKSKHNDETIKFEPFTDEEIEKAKKIAEKYIKKVEVR